MTKTLPASEVARNFDALLDGIANGDEVLVEKGGRVVARLVPNGRREVTLESMRGRLKIVGDIVEPLDEPWEANE